MLLELMNYQLFGISYVTHYLPQKGTGLSRPLLMQHCSMKLFEIVVKERYPAVASGTTSSVTLTDDEAHTGAAHTDRAPEKSYTMARAARLSMALIWLMQAWWCNVILCGVRADLQTLWRQ